MEIQLSALAKQQEPRILHVEIYVAQRPLPPYEVTNPYAMLMFIQQKERMENTLLSSMLLGFPLPEGTWGTVKIQLSALAKQQEPRILHVEIYVNQEEAPHLTNPYAYVHPTEEPNGKNPAFEHATRISASRR